MQTFDQHLMDLVTQDIVEYDNALANSSNPSDFELQMKTFRRRSRMSAKVKAPAEVPAAEPPAPEPPDRPAGFTDDLSSMLPS